jgi:hypothetical protein
MSIWGWSTLNSLTHPIFLLASLALVVGVVTIVRRQPTVALAAEFGTLFGFVFAVAVWGSLGYYFDFPGETKLFFACMVVLDALALSILARLGLNWYEQR